MAGAMKFLETIGFSDKDLDTIYNTLEYEIGMRAGARWELHKFEGSDTVTEHVVIDIITSHTIDSDPSRLSNIYKELEDKLDCKLGINKLSILLRVRD